ncbi:MAG: protein phosphatase CheZ [Gammaproteobacteria bacterium]|nr:protein phosphatase CheZ [Gammaproteobacteria bacterium]
MSEKSAEESSYLTDEYISRLKTLSEALESGDETRIHGLVGELTTLRESSLYQELGKITREIHDSINAFGNDERIAELAQEAIPDAKERLSFIVTKTEEAAHKTMEGAEAAMILMDGFSDKAKVLLERWTSFRNRQLSKEEFIVLNDDINGFLDSFGSDSQAVNSQMTDIMLAQDYQDITGQMIKQVVTMVQEVEDKLVRLVTISGAWCSDTNTEKSSGEIAEGPQLPTADQSQVATSQGDVDDILASLGF